MKAKTKRKHKLKYQLGIDPKDGEYVVHFQVLYQDPRFLGGRYTPTYGLNVKSESCPELDEETVWLRGGWKGSDNEAATRSFKTEAEAQDYVARVHAALHSWAENWHGFRSPAKLSIFTV